MKSIKVTDPAILAQLNGGSRVVTDPQLLKQLNSDEDEDIPYTPPPERKGIGAVAEDAANLPGKALDFGMGIPEQIPGGWHQIFNEPGRAMKNILAGAGELGKSAINQPYEGLKYLGEKGVIPDWLKQYTETGLPIPFTGKHIPTHIGDLGIENAIGLGGAPHEGDEILRQLIPIGAALEGVKSIPGVENFGNRVGAQLQHGGLKRSAEEAEQQLAGANTEHTEAKGQYDALKDFLERQPGYETSSPAALQRKAVEAQQQAAGLRQQSEQVPEHLRATEEPTAPEKTPLSIVEPVRAGEKPEISDANIKQAENAVKTNQQATAQHAADISEHLGEGNAHRKRVADIMNPILEAKQSEIGKGYDKYINGLKDKEVTLSNPRDAKAITQDIQKLLKAGDTSSKDMLALTDELANLGKGETMPAGKFVSAYRSLRGMAQKTRSSAYGKPPQEFDRLTEAADSMDKDVARMKDIIDKGLGEENLKELTKLNTRYATEVAPLFKNKFYQHMQANSKAPTNMIEALTNEPYIKETNPNKITGTQILNEIVKSNPELLKNVVGERFADKPKELHKWDEAANQFIQHMPDLKQLREKHFQAQQAEAQSKLDLEKVKHEHNIQSEKANEEHKKKVQEAAEKTRIKKEQVHKENVTNAKEHAQKAKYYKMQEQIKALDERHAKLTENAKKMQKVAGRKNQSLKNKVEAEQKLSEINKQISKIRQDRSKLWKTAKTIGYGVGIVAVGTPIAKKAKSLITGS